MEVIHPWTAHLSAYRWKWAIGYLSMRGLSIDSKVYFAPKSPRFISQVTKLVQFSLSNRNWIVCLNESPSYMRDLFTHAMASYVFTTSERALIVDVDDLIEAANDYEGEKRDIVENADLLMVCNCEPDNLALKYRKGTISNILHRRKHNGRATMLDLFFPKIANPLPTGDRNNMLMSISNIFGSSVYELFTGDRSKCVIVRQDRRTNGKRSK